MKILFVGDVFGRPGRRTVGQILPGLRKECGADLVIANGENAASGVGITGETAEGIPVIEGDSRIIRPVNYPPGTPGRGFGVFPAGGRRVAVVSVLGRIFMQPYDCPFRSLEAVLGSLGGETPMIVVDVHAEATSEKVALGWYFDGRISAFIGTHTHVQTADERILPRGTACLTDVGMTGPHDSVIGVRKELALKRLLAQMPVRYQPADGDLRLHAALITLDPANGRALAIERIQRRVEA